MKNSKKALMVFIVAISITVVSASINTMALPPESYYYPTSVHIDPGDLHSGNLESLKYDDGNYLVAIADWYFILFFWYFFADIEIDFPNTIADFLAIELKDNVVGTNLNGHVYYTSGDPQIFWSSDKADGTFTINLDTSRIVDYIVVEFEHAGGWGDKYVKIDYAYLVRFN